MKPTKETLKKIWSFFKRTTTRKGRIRVFGTEWIDYEMSLYWTEVEGDYFMVLDDCYVEKSSKLLKVYDISDNILRKWNFDTDNEYLNWKHEKEIEGRKIFRSIPIETSKLMDIFFDSSNMMDFIGGVDHACRPSVQIPVPLNSDYEALVEKGNADVMVGCQTIPISVIMNVVKVWKELNPV